MTPEIVFLDAGDTLFTERHTRDEIYARTFREFGAVVEPERLGAWRHEEHDKMPEVFDGHRRYTDGWFREFIARMLKRCDHEADAEAVRAVLADHFSRPDSFCVFADTFPALDDLTERGRRLAIVSNWSDRLTGIVEGLGLRPYFEGIFISAVVGHTKPDAGIFRHAASVLEAPPEVILHVGDHPVNDLLGARRAGLGGALLLDRARARSEPDVIRSLQDISGRLA